VWDGTEAYDGTGTLYINGIEADSTDGAGVLKNLLDEGTYGIGGDTGITATVRYFDGFIDEVAVWRSALSADNAEWLYQNSIKGIPPDGELPGDFNSDGNVDTADYTIWADNYTGSGGTGGTPSTGDANGDGAVDTADYTIWADNYTGSSTAAGAVPEPGTAGLLVSLGILGLAARRRRVDRKR
jgi:hypothetical protein